MPDWTPFEPPKAPDGAPNVLYIVLDDVGFSAMSPYGGPITEAAIGFPNASGTIPPENGMLPRSSAKPAGTPGARLDRGQHEGRLDEGLRRHPVMSQSDVDGCGSPDGCGSSESSRSGMSPGVAAIRVP